MPPSIPGHDVSVTIQHESLPWVDLRIDEKFYAIRAVRWAAMDPLLLAEMVVSMMTRREFPLGTGIVIIASDRAIRYSSPSSTVELYIIFLPALELNTRSCYGLVQQLSRPLSAWCALKGQF
jgi:hypothetical protein